MPEPRAAKVIITKDGPYRVVGAVPLANQIIETDSEGQSREWREGKSYTVQGIYELCRCGQSSNKPFCDDSHLSVDFDGTETANRAPYLDQAELFDGPQMALTDVESLCAYARFCDPDGRVWNVVEATDDPKAQEIVKHESGHCPSGRLVAWNKATNEPYEPSFEPSIGLVQDPQVGVSGPVWVRSGITIESADGTAYEVRNRVTLCRCGASSNKPFCDGSHASVGFRDDTEPDD
jgi:CDGSH-type Zn-finger protein